ncbi:cell wall protein, partial [Aspergillus sclerotialis]
MRSSLLLLAGLASHALGLPSTSVEDRSIDVDVGADINIGNIHADLDLDVFIGDILGGGVQSSTSLLGGLSAQAAAALQAGALGCSAGKIHHSALVELKHWLHGAAHIEAGLKNALLHWCDAGAQATLEADVIAGLSVLLPTCSDIVSKGGLYVTIDGIFEAHELEAAAVLDAATQSSLNAFIKGASHLEAEVKAALSLCAGGGVVTSLTEEVKASLKAWLHSSDCGLDHGLKISILAWLQGKIESGVVSLGHLSDGSLSSVSVGASLLALVDESGALVQTARQSLLAFLHSSAAAHLEADIKHVLESCAKGELATSISAEVRSALAVWLSSSSCSIGAELKSVLLFWLSFAVDVNAHIGLDLGIVGDLLSFLTGTLGQVLGGGLRGILTILLGGESFLSLSLKARAEIIAIIGGATSIELPSNCITIIIEWITGCIIPGHGSGSSSSMIPPPSSTAPAASTPGVSTPVSTPVVSTSAPAPVESSSVPVYP